MLGLAICLVASAANAQPSRPPQAVVGAANTFFDSLKAGSLNVAFASMSPHGQSQGYSQLVNDVSLANRLFDFSHLGGRQLFFTGTYQGNWVVCMTERPVNGSGAVAYLTATFSKSDPRIYDFEIAPQPFEGCH